MFPKKIRFRCGFESTAEEIRERRLGDNNDGKKVGVVAKETALILDDLFDVVADDPTFLQLFFKAR